jgi:RNA polymerase sigma-70 factor (ECF subfamily)
MDACNAITLGIPDLYLSLRSHRMTSLDVDACVSAIDRQDIEQALGHDEDAFAHLVQRYQNAISHWLWRFTREPAMLEELVQEVFIEAWQGLSKFQGKSTFKTWLFTIATRVGYRYWRSKSQETTRSAEVRDWLIATGQEAELPPSAAATALYDLLAGLPPRDRLVLTLLYFEDLDTAEIAQLTGWSRVLVKVQAYRARNKLKNMLEAAGYGRKNHD